MNRPNKKVRDLSVRNVVITSSRWCTYLCIGSMTVLMVLEVIMRYFAGAPLGWNISLIQNVLLPGLLFLGLPWAYVTGAHVSADLVYDRLPVNAQWIARGIASFVIIIGLLGLVIGGYLAASDAFMYADAPPPLSARVPLAAWVWKTFMPIGAAATLLLLIIDFIQPAQRTRRS